MSMKLSLDLSNATVGELYAFATAIESTSTGADTPLTLEGSVLSVTASRSVSGRRQSNESTTSSGGAEQTLTSLIDALIARRTN
ncbi:hypothetical protein P8T85_08550 [Corynebacterium rouxii]|uniref:Uncharacterized protein n=2 Tax=Corynebacterium rouxii TaxID=2719119 RepID=A0A6I8MGX0_9CORY|nr:hypothetical protein [Corynebacterium rouxii]MDT9409244.1 hypothetical protein [Corynebacterium rouxii]MDT9411477.1 hypothetical protein [Corynebacterium rouxii]VZH85752.1 hypothetical protein FRC0190_01689 [Corynebacterium rouxii]